MGRIRNAIIRLFGGVTPQAERVRALAEWLRNYNELVSIGGVNGDWSLSAVSQDQEVWQNNFALRQRLRDLFDGSAFFRKYQDQLDANVFGEHGHKLRSKVKEEEDRVIYVDEEKSVILRHIERMERITEWVGKKTGIQVSKEWSAFRFGKFDGTRIEGNERAKGTVKAGALDVFANQIIERKWNEWKRAEFCTVTGKLTYREVQRLRIVAAARDGDFFIRLIRDPRINKFGFSLQLINSEWCDFNYNCPDSTRLPAKDVPEDVLEARAAGPCSIRMGVEINQWGRPIAYHFIKRQAQDWQFAPPGGYFMQSGKDYVVISAKEIIHYAQFDYADSTRPAAWGVAAIPVARHLQKYVEAAVTAARAGACQTGFFYSDLVPEGGTIPVERLPDPCKAAKEYQLIPGMVKGLPYGIKFQPNNPNNPNSQFSPFRKEGYRELAAAVRGGNYNILANDSEGISYSTGRIFSLDDREQWKLIQRFDIDKAERPIFEAWLESALMQGAIPLPFAKFEKFNKPHFTGRRWDWVDPSKDAKALETELMNRITSWSRIFDERSEDLEEVWTELAEDMMLAESLGITLPTFGEKKESDKDEDEKEETPPVAGKNGSNGRHVPLAV